MRQATIQPEIGVWEAGMPYEFRAVVKHPVLTMYGNSKMYADSKR
jgi:hypothetical protein